MRGSPWIWVLVGMIGGRVLGAQPPEEGVPVYPVPWDGNLRVGFLYVGNFVSEAGEVRYGEVQPEVVVLPPEEEVRIPVLEEEILVEARYPGEGEWEPAEERVVLHVEIQDILARLERIVVKDFWSGEQEGELWATAGRQRVRGRMEVSSEHLAREVEVYSSQGMLLKAAIFGRRLRWALMDQRFYFRPFAFPCPLLKEKEWGYHQLCQFDCALLPEGHPYDILPRLRFLSEWREEVRFTNCGLIPPNPTSTTFNFSHYDATGLALMVRYVERLTHDVMFINSNLEAADRAKLEEAIKALQEDETSYPPDYKIHPYTGQGRAVWKDIGLEGRLHLWVAVPYEEEVPIGGTEVVAGLLKLLAGMDKGIQAIDLFHVLFDQMAQRPQEFGIPLGGRRAWQQARVVLAIGVVEKSRECIPFGMDLKGIPQRVKVRLVADIGPSTGKPGEPLPGWVEVRLASPEYWTKERPVGETYWPRVLGEHEVLWGELEELKGYAFLELDQGFNYVLRGKPGITGYEFKEEDAVMYPCGRNDAPQEVKVVCHLRGVLRLVVETQDHRGGPIPGEVTVWWNNSIVGGQDQRTQRDAEGRYTVTMGYVPLGSYRIEARALEPYQGKGEISFELSKPAWEVRIVVRMEVMTQEEESELPP